MLFFILHIQNHVCINAGVSPCLVLEAQVLVLVLGHKVLVLESQVLDNKTV